MSSLKVTLLLIATFICGVIIGWQLTKATSHEWVVDVQSNYVLKYDRRTGDILLLNKFSTGWKELNYYP